MAILQLFFPQFFDPDSPQYVESDILMLLIDMSEAARPWCLPEKLQDYAQAMYTAYLVSLREDTSSGVVETPVSGPITMEKEGDISVSYGEAKDGAAATTNARPSSDPWSLWNKMWSQCGRGAITTRYGDPMRNVSGVALTSVIAPMAVNVWRPM
jgi:hypothetical protein